MLKKKTRKTRKKHNKKVEKDLKIDVPDELITPEGSLLQTKVETKVETSIPEKPKENRYVVWGMIRDNETKLYSSVIIHTDSLDGMNETCMWCSYVRAYSSFEVGCFRNNSGPNRGKIL